MKFAALRADNRASWLVTIGAGLASLCAGWAVGVLLHPSAASPAKTVAMRFPANWTDIPYSPPPAEVAEASEVAEPPQWLNFTNPQPVFAAASFPSVTPPV